MEKKEASQVKIDPNVIIPSHGEVFFINITKLPIALQRTIEGLSASIANAERHNLIKPVVPSELTPETEIEQI